MFLPAMLTAKSVGEAVFGFVLNWWRELLIVFLIGAMYVMHARVEARDRTIAKRNETIQQMKDDAKVAESKSAERGATTGAEATVVYVERNEKDRPVVERVVERVRNVCVRSPDPVRVPVSQGSAGPDDTAIRTQDREDDAFREAIADDLQACNSELNKLRELQAWVISNGGG